MLLFKRITAFLLSVFMIIIFAGCSNSTKVNLIENIVSQSDEDLQTTQNQAVLENTNFCFVLDAQTTHFTVKDKRNGKIYSSVVASDISGYTEDTAKAAVSDVRITYYEEQTNAVSMYSATDSVDRGNYKVENNSETIRVTYNFGETEPFVPEILDENTYNEIIKKLENDALRRRFARYYICYDRNDKTDDYDAKAKKYPILKKQKLYIIDDLISENSRDELADYLEDIGYRNEDYQEMINKLGIEISNDNQTVEFIVPIEYTLTEYGFNATILSELIFESSEAFKLQEISLLEYFGSDSSSDGYFLIPDGSGAIIDFSCGEQPSVFNFYGKDYTTISESLELIERTATFPVFGMSYKDGGIFAIVDGGASIASLTASPISESSPVNHANISFSVRMFEAAESGDYNLFSKTLPNVNLSVNYTLLTSDENNWSDMANCFRETLKKNGALSSKNSSDTPIYIDYLCMITEEKSIMGIPYTRKIILSNIRDITESVKKIINADAGSVIVRLIGYSSDGYEHKAYTKFNLERRVGTYEDLIALSKLLEENGGKLFLDADMQFAYRSGNGFDIKEDSARFLNRLVVCKGKYDIVTREYGTELLNYFISPANYLKYSSSFITSLKNELKDINIGLSYGQVGKYIGGDYGKRNISRIDSEGYILEALNNTRKEGYEMLFENGNAYVIPYADHLLSVANMSSELDSENISVPFTQTVLHGSISYAAFPQNLSTNSRLSQLYSIAFGSAPYMVFITNSDRLISNTKYETEWYSLQDDSRLDDFLQFCIALRDLRKSTANEYIISSDKISRDVICTVYSNGVKVYVNLEDSKVKAEGVNSDILNFNVGGEQNEK